MKKTVFAIMALAAAIFAGCEEEQGFVREFEEAELSMSADTVTIADAGSKVTVTLTTEETDIDATVDYAYRTWLKATVAEKSVVVEAIADNLTDAVREGKILVTAGSKGKTAQKYIIVKQSKADPSKLPSLSIDPKTISLAKTAGDSKTVAVTTNQSSITATVAASGTEWVSATVSGTTVTIASIQDNPQGTVRNTTVTIKAGSLSETVQVSQEAGDVPTLSLAAETATIDNTADATASVAIESNQTGITATSSEAWLSATIEGTNLVVKALSANEETTARTATVTVAVAGLTATLTVTQKAAMAPCPYKIGDAYGSDGIVAAINQETKKVIIMSLKQTKGAFSTNTTDSIGYNDTSVESGAEATAGIQKLSFYSAEVFPAVAWVVGLGSGWYIPSVKELEAVAEGVKSIDADGGLATINAKLTALSGDTIELGVYYWTVIEASSVVANQNVVRFAKDGDNSTSKGNFKKNGTTRGIRAVKTITY